MKDLIAFFLKTGKVKHLKQRGYVLRGVRNPPTVGGHSFREALMAWILGDMGNSGLDTNKLVKIALVHDLCAGYAGDLTPYEPLIKKAGRKDIKRVFIGWVRLPKKEKELFYKLQRTKERKSLKELTTHLPKPLALQLNRLWDEYEQGSTREGRFIQQVDMLENFLEALECWKEDKNFPIESWWQQMKELMNDPILLDFLGDIDSHFYKKVLAARKKNAKKREEARRAPR